MFQYKYLLILGFILVLSSCQDAFEQVVELEVPEHTSLLAVTGNFTLDDDTLKLYVGQTVGILDNSETNVVNNANVELLKNDQKIAEMKDSGEGVYTASTSLLDDLNAEYKIKVAASSFESVEAIQTIPEKVEIISANYEIDGGLTPDGYRTNKIEIEFKDPDQEGNYYLFNAYTIYDDFDEFENEIYPQSIDPLAETINNGVVLSDASINGNTYTVQLSTWFYYNQNPDPYYENSERLFVKIRSISREEYLYLKSLQAYWNAQDNPFAEPSVVYSNIEGGAGLFSISAADDYEIIF